MGKPLTCIEKGYLQDVEDNPGTDPTGTSVYDIIYKYQLLSATVAGTTTDPDYMFLQ